jgi:DNA repair exonuclease SbcCD ATPase subunit
MEISSHRRVLDRLKTERRLQLKTKDELVEVITSKQKLVDDMIQARWVLADVAKKTQDKFVGYVENLVTMAIQSVYDRKTKFVVRFEMKRNKSECVLLVQDEDGEAYDPKDEDGGGLLDIISIALRVVLWSVERPQSTNVLFLDEPFKFVGRFFPKAVAFLRGISHKLGIQLIVNTHDRDLVDLADRAWVVTNDGRGSTVELLEDRALNIMKEERKELVVRRRGAK